MTKILYLYKAGRSDRLASGRLAQASSFPKEFFYALPELKAAGRDADFLEEKDLPRGAVLGFACRVLSRLFQMIVPNVPADLTQAIIFFRHRAKLAEAEVLVATTQTQGYSLGLLKRLGLLRARVLFLVMGTADEKLTPRALRFTGYCLQGCELLPISEGEAGELKRLFPGHPSIRYVPFGIDFGFWAAGENSEPEPEQPYVLSIGNDRHRDYDTLLAAWRPEFPVLKIITRLDVSSDLPNVEILAGDWRQNRISDADIRQIMRRALFVVLPIRDTWQPSGQSACLQSMACGRAVVLSDIKGLWDAKVMRDGETCRLVPTGSPEALNRVVRELLASPEQAEDIGRKALAEVEKALTTEHMAEALARLIDT